MPANISHDYISVGGNRHSAASDWSTTSGLLAFGADQNVAIWEPLNDSGRGISALLSGYTSKVTAVKFFVNQQDGPAETLLTGSASGEVLLWKFDKSNQRWTLLDTAKAHDGTVNALATYDQANIFVTGGADASLKLWRLRQEKLELVSNLALQPRFIPLALAVGLFPSGDSGFLVVGGTRNDMQVYSVEGLSSTPRFRLCASLKGHEAWIRSLALTPHPEGGFLLASASQDKYVRLWRFHEGNAVLPKRPVDPTGAATTGNTLTAKVQTVSAGESKYSITFDALLLGHEDWVYSAAWRPQSSSPQLLTASADGSLSIWEVDSGSGIWVSISRLGEISSHKGATTATGSAGGFWTGLWAPDGQMVTCLGRTGSWRLWQYSEQTQFWTQRHGSSGHVSSANGICWAPDGSYLLSTSSDQTTRLHAEWKRGTKRSWHEFSRPQIHGYDLNCIASTTPYQFSSGADEKLLRVFNEPKDIAQMLHNLCQIPLPSDATRLPDTAAIPVLGLSNKAVDDDDVAAAAAQEDVATNGTTNELGLSLSDIKEPPTEDLLSRHTLWPEHEKLYGHGYEISEAATPVDGSVLATACKASSIDHAVIRLYDTNNWHEIRPPLSAHSLTVTRLAFSSHPPGYLLSVSRDRQWAIFKQAELEPQGDGSSSSRSWTRVAIYPKAHSRMILDCAWLGNGSTQELAFATAGRDKVVKLWSKQSGDSADGLQFTCKASIARKSPVTAISALCHGPTTECVLAVGEDDGSISLHLVDYSEDGPQVRESIEVDRHFSPSKTVHRLAWRPMSETGERAQGPQLAVASDDGSVRILRVDFR
ncbi:Elongator complex protein 2 [Exophiala dermatitidis]